MASTSHTFHKLIQLSCCLLLAFAVTNVRSAPLYLSADTTQVELAAHFQLYEDPTGKLQISDVASPPFSARFMQSTMQGVANLGYSHSTWWMRVDVEAPRPGLWYLEIGYPSLDSVELFIPDEKGDYQHMLAGDRLPFSERLLPHHNLVFPLQLSSGNSSFYLRIASAGNLTIPATLWEPQAFHWHNQTVYAGLAIYFGMLLALGVYNLLLYISLRERTYLYYVLFLASMAVGIASMNGLAPQFIWPEWPVWTHFALPVGMASSGLFAVFFTRAFLGTRNNLPYMDRVLMFFIVWFAISILINLISYQWAEMMTSLSSMLFCPVALTVGIISYRRGFPGARYFLLAWTILLFGSISLAARNFGLLPTNFITVNGFQIGSSIEMLLLSFALADRINVLKREKALADARLLRAQQENIAALKESELMLEKRVAERTCELAEANARLESLSRQDPLTGLGNRNELEDAWRKLASRSERYNEKIGLLLLDLNNFKPINDNHGHNAGDRVLQEVATRLRKVVRTSDIVVRLGGDEFVVLFGDIATNSDLDAFKIKIADAISAPIEVDSNRLVVGASIGSAIYPIDAMTLTELLRQADAAMYQNKMQQGAGR